MFQNFLVSVIEKFKYFKGIHDRIDCLLMSNFEDGCLNLSTSECCSGFNMVLDVSSLDDRMSMQIFLLSTTPYELLTLV